MVIRENGNEVSISVNDSASAFATNFKDLDGLNLGGAVLKAQALPNASDSEVTGDHNVAFQLRIEGPIKYVEIGGELIWLDKISMAYNVGNNIGGTGDGGVQPVDPVCVDFESLTLGHLYNVGDAFYADTQDPSIYTAEVALSLYVKDYNCLLYTSDAADE